MIVQPPHHVEAHAKGHKGSPTRIQAGTALLSVLFILVLLTTLAAFTAADENLAIRRLSNQREYAQSLQVALGGEMWAMKELERDLTSSVSGANYDYFGEAWAKLHETGAVSVEDGEMFVWVDDESGKFNLNNLIEGKKPKVKTKGQKQANPDDSPPDCEENDLVANPFCGPDNQQAPGLNKNSIWYDLFVLILESPGVDLPPELADAVVDWVDEDSKKTEPNGVEDSFYQSFEQPYRTGNRPFASVAELGLVKGFSPSAVKALLPLVTTLPLEKKGKNFVATKININTAPMGVLAALSGNKADQQELENIMTSRLTTPYDNVSGFVTSMKSTGMKGGNLGQLVDVKSNYFSTISCAKYGKIEVALTSLLYRNRSEKEVGVASRQRLYECKREAQ